MLGYSTVRWWKEFLALLLVALVTAAVLVAMNWAMSKSRKGWVKFLAGYLAFLVVALVVTLVIMALD